MFALCSNSLKRSSFIVRMLVMATEWPGMSAVSHLISDFVIIYYMLEIFSLLLQNFILTIQSANVLCQTSRETTIQPP